LATYRGAGIDGASAVDERSTDGAVPAGAGRYVDSRGRRVGATAAMLSAIAPSPAVNNTFCDRLGVFRASAGSRIASMRPSNSFLSAIGSAVAGAPYSRTDVTMSSR